MARLHRLTRERVDTIPIPRDEPLRLAADGEIWDGSAYDCWAASVLPFSRASGARLSYAVVVREGARVALGCRPVTALAEIRDRDHLFLGSRELLFSSDALPAVVDDAPGSACPSCSRRVGEAAGRAIRECPGCGQRACESCFRAFPKGACPIPGCGVPASLDRALWEPGPEEFATRDAEEAP